MSADRPSWLKPDAALDRRLSALLDAGRGEQPSALQLDALAERLAATFAGPGPGGGDAGGSGGGAGGNASAGTGAGTGASSAGVGASSGALGSSGLAAGAAGAETAAAAAGTASKLGPWLAAAGSLVLIAGTSVLWLSRAEQAVERSRTSLVSASQPPARAPDVPAMPAAAREPASIEAPTAVAVVENAAQGELATERASGPSAPRARHAQRPARPAAQPQQDLAYELRLLDAAKRLLASAPARSLALTERHARLFPAGQLAQERELLAIETLLRLGDRVRAEARGQAFLTQHPGSSHAPRVRALLAAATPTPASTAPASATRTSTSTTSTTRTSTTTASAPVATPPAKDAAPRSR